MPINRAGNGGEVYRDDFVRVVSDEQVSTADAKQLAQRIERAWDYDVKVQKWKNPAPLQGPLTVEVLSPEGFARASGDSSGAVGGFCTGPNLFVVPDRVLGEKTALDEDTIAHELTHVQDFRQAGPGQRSVPILIEEGKAYVNGDRYPATEHLDNRQTSQVGRVLAGMTARAAASVLSRFKSAADEATPGLGFLGEVTGALFVEYLRTRLHGTGVHDAVPKLAQAVAQTGQGHSFGAAFSSAFKVTLAQAEHDFLNYVERTEGNPSARLQGTVYESALQAA